MSGPTLTFSQTSGLVTDEVGNHVALGWSGNHDGKGNPAMQAVHCVGPLPQGLYRVDPWEEQHGHLGPMVAHLEQVEGETHGRDGFYFHGPAQDPKHYGQESMGCIVVPRSGRLKVREAAPEGAYVRVVA